MRRFSAGFDLVVHSVTPTLQTPHGGFLIRPHDTVRVYCGFRMALPKKYFALIVPRSSWRRKGLTCLAVYDPGYLGNAEPFVTNLSGEDVVICPGERVLQMLILPIERVELIPVSALPDNLYNRGGGTGSTVLSNVSPLP